MFFYPVPCDSFSVYTTYILRITLCLCPISCEPLCLSVLYYVTHSEFMHHISYKPLCVYLFYIFWTSVFILYLMNHSVFICPINCLVNLCVYLSCTLWIFQCLYFLYLKNRLLFIHPISCKSLCLSICIFRTLCCCSFCCTDHGSTKSAGFSKG